MHYKFYFAPKIYSNRMRTISWKSENVTLHFLHPSLSCLRLPCLACALLGSWSTTVTGRTSRELGRNRQTDRLPAFFPSADSTTTKMPQNHSAIHANSPQNAHQSIWWFLDALSDLYKWGCPSVRHTRVAILFSQMNLWGYVERLSPIESGTNSWIFFYSQVHSIQFAIYLSLEFTPSILHSMKPEVGVELFVAIVKLFATTFQRQTLQS